MEGVPAGYEDDFSDDDFEFSYSNYNNEHQHSSYKNLNSLSHEKEHLLDKVCLKSEDFRNAVLKGDSNYVVEALTNGFNPDTILKPGWSAIFDASTIGSVEIVKLLVKYKASVNLKCDTFTPLMAVCQSGKRNNEAQLFQCAQILIENGAKVNDHDKHLMTPLMYASKYGFSKLVKLLCEHDASKNLQETRGWTALCFAASNGFSHVVKVLLEFGADHDITTFDGQKPVDLAFSNGHKMLSGLLEKYDGTDTKELGELKPFNSSKKKPQSRELYTSLFKVRLQMAAKRIKEVVAENRMNEGVLKSRIIQVKEADATNRFDLTRNEKTDCNKDKCSTEVSYKPSTKDQNSTQIKTPVAELETHSGDEDLTLSVPIRGRQISKMRRNCSREELINQEDVKEKNERLHRFEQLKQKIYKRKLRQAEIENKRSKKALTKFKLFKRKAPSECCESRYRADEGTVDDITETDKPESAVIKSTARKIFTDINAIINDNNIIQHEVKHGNDGLKIAENITKDGTRNFNHDGCEKIKSDTSNAEHRKDNETFAMINTKISGDQNNNKKEAIVGKTEKIVPVVKEAESETNSLTIIDLESHSVEEDLTLPIPSRGRQISKLRRNCSQEELVNLEDITEKKERLQRFEQLAQKLCKRKLRQEEIESKRSKKSLTKFKLLKRKASSECSESRYTVDKELENVIVDKKNRNTVLKNATRNSDSFFTDIIILSDANNETNSLKSIESYSTKNDIKNKSMKVRKEYAFTNDIMENEIALIEKTSKGPWTDNIRGNEYAESEYAWRGERTKRSWWKRQQGRWRGWRKRRKNANTERLFRKRTLFKSFRLRRKASSHEMLQVPDKIKQNEDKNTLFTRFINFFGKKRRKKSERICKNNNSTKAVQQSAKGKPIAYMQQTSTDFKCDGQDTDDEDARKKSDQSTRPKTAYRTRTKHYMTTDTTVFSSVEDIKGNKVKHPHQAKTLTEPLNRTSSLLSLESLSAPLPPPTTTSKLSHEVKSQIEPMEKEVIRYIPDYLPSSEVNKNVEKKRKSKGATGMLINRSEKNNSCNVNSNNRSGDKYRCSVDKRNMRNDNLKGGNQVRVRKLPSITKVGIEKYVEERNRQPMYGSWSRHFTDNDFQYRWDRPIKISTTQSITNNTDWANKTRYSVGLGSQVIKTYGVPSTGPSSLGSNRRVLHKSNHNITNSEQHLRQNEILFRKLSAKDSGYRGKSESMIKGQSTEHSFQAGSSITNGSETQEKPTDIPACGYETIMIDDNEFKQTSTVTCEPLKSSIDKIAQSVYDVDDYGYDEDIEQQMLEIMNRKIEPKKSPKITEVHKYQQRLSYSRFDAMHLLKDRVGGVSFQVHIESQPRPPTPFSIPKTFLERGMASQKSKKSLQNNPVLIEKKTKTAKRNINLEKLEEERKRLQAEHYGLSQDPSKVEPVPKDIEESNEEIKMEKRIKACKDLREQLYKNVKEKEKHKLSVHQINARPSTPRTVRFPETFVHRAINPVEVVKKNGEETLLDHTCKTVNKNSTISNEKLQLQAQKVKESFAALNEMERRQAMEAKKYSLKDTISVAQYSDVIYNDKSDVTTTDNTADKAV